MMMEPETSDLIDRMKSNPMNEGSARLWGRLDALEMVMRNFNFCCDSDDFSDGSYCNQCAVFLGFKDEIREIKNALCVEDVQNG